MRSGIVMQNNYVSCIKGVNRVDGETFKKEVDMKNTFKIPQNGYEQFVYWDQRFCLDRCSLSFFLQYIVACLVLCSCLLRKGFIAERHLHWLGNESVAVGTPEDDVISAHMWDPFCGCFSVSMIISNGNLSTVITYCNPRRNFGNH